MARLASALAALLLTGCYLAHRIQERPDGGDAARPPAHAIECCVVATCGARACAEGEECTARGCAPACEGPRCAGVCCPAGARCVEGACAGPALACASDDDCAGGTCDPVSARCAARGEHGCYAPRPFEPAIEWEVPTDSISVPLVAPLGDHGAPALVVLELPTHPDADARLVALDGADGTERWALGDDFTAHCSHSAAAAGDLDGDGDVEVAVLARRIVPHVHVGARPPRPCVIAPGDDPSRCPVFPPDRGPFHDHGPYVDARFEHAHPENACSRFADAPGTLLIVSRDGAIEREVQLPLRSSDARRTHLLAIADLDADGLAEVVASGAIVGAEGVRWADERLHGVSVAVGDVDLDGRMELVTTRHAFEDDGTLRWARDGIAQDGHVAIARVLPGPASGPPQVIALDGRRLVVRDGATGETLLGPVGFAAGVSAGPPTIADLDGDGEVEIGVAADHAYVVLDLELPPPHVRWELRSEDATPGTVGAAAFDFDGDGAADLAYADECHVTILNGRDGTPMWARPNPSRTVWEYPVVADLDADGEAELAVVSNLRAPAQLDELGCWSRANRFDYTEGGIRVLGDRLGSWSGTRTIWNQHGYDRTIGLDGRVPTAPPRPWDEHNTVRASPWSGAGAARALPDLRVAALRVVGAACGGEDVVVEVRVENRGSAAAPAGVAVDLGPAGAVRTAAILDPGGAEWVRSPPLSRRAIADLSARVDPDDVHRECDERFAASLELGLACE